MKNKSFILGIFLLFVVVVNAQTVAINEFMSSNSSCIQDLDGDFVDWIELYNNSNEIVNLNDYTISDDIEDINKWVFPSVIIPPQGFLLIFASGKDRYEPAELHTNFKIKQTGEKLFLSNSSAELIFTTDSVFVATDKSYGSIQDGSLLFVSFENPTPNLSNSISNDIYSSHQSGFYNNEFLLTLISANENQEIYYTLNGEMPTKNSLLYSSPLLISNITSASNSISLIPTTPLEGQYPLSTLIWKEPNNVYKSNIIRFAGFEDDTIKSKVYTNTFFVDPGIFNRYTFPVVSIVTDSLNLFDYDTGIYIPGKTFDELGFNWFPTGNYHNRGVEWERNIHISYFENNGSLGFESDAGMRMRGYGSTACAQKSFGVYFRNEYGVNKIDYPVFEVSNTNIYKRLIFRNGGNDFLYAHLRDALLQDLLKPLDLELQNFKPSVVFFNGEYWGIHGIREKYDKYYFEYQFGIAENNINILSICGSVEEGSNSDFVDLINYINNHEMSLNESFDFVSGKIDIQNFIDFQIAEIYYANYDWPCNNFKIWKTNDLTSKWRFLIFDLDYTFGYDHNCTYDTPSMEHATSMQNGWPYCECSNLLFRKLLENITFKQQFIDRFAYHLNTTFNSENVLNKINDFEALFSPEMDEHIARWSYPSNFSQWTSELDILREFAKERPCFIRDNIINFFNLIDFDFDCDLIIADNNFDNKLIVFPNPCENRLNVNTVRLQNETLFFYNIQGALVKSVVVSEGITNVDVSNLASGMYLLMCVNKKSIVIIK